MRQRTPGPGYKWIALSNTTLGVLMATVNASILLIALPDIFRGIGLNPLQPGNSSLLLWLIMGYMVVTAVLVVSFGRLGDMYGRVRMYNLGFAVFTLFSVALSLTWMHGTAGALWLILMRVLQGVGGAMLMANSAAILTDAFPAGQRGLALGLNQVAGIAGSFIGLILGGLLGPVQWHLVFLVSAPFGLFGTAWAYLKLRELGVRRPVNLDWWGNVTFGVGLVALLVGITYGIEPYGGHTMGWANPWVIAAMAGGAALLIAFCFIETRVQHPMFRMELFRIRAFTAGNLAGLLSGLGRGGLMFILIIWLQGIYPARISLQPDPAVGGHLHAAAHRRVPARRAGVGLAVGSLRRTAVRHRRHGGRRGLVLAARGAAGQLRLLAVRAHPAAERHRDGPVRLAEPGRHHEQPATRTARCRVRHVRHVPELIHGAVHRHLLHADHPGAGGDAAVGAAARADRPGGARGGRGQGGCAAPGRCGLTETPAAFSFRCPGRCPCPSPISASSGASTAPSTAARCSRSSHPKHLKAQSDVTVQPGPAGT